MDKDSPNCPRIKDDLVVREEDDGAFNFDPIKDLLKAVNETGVIVLKELDGKSSMDAIIKKVSSQYPEVDGEAIKKDVEAFIESLKVRGFLVI